MTRHDLIESLAEAIARAEATDYGTMTFDWKYRLSGSDRKHYRKLATAALEATEKETNIKFSRGQFTWD